MVYPYHDCLLLIRLAPARQHTHACARSTSHISRVWLQRRYRREGLLSNLVKRGRSGGTPAKGVPVVVVVGPHVGPLVLELPSMSVVEKVYEPYHHRNCSRNITDVASDTQRRHAAFTAASAPRHIGVGQRKLHQASRIGLGNTTTSALLMLGHRYSRHSGISTRYARACRLHATGRTGRKRTGRKRTGRKRTGCKRTGSI